MKVPALVMGNTLNPDNPYAPITYPIYPHLGSAQKSLIQFEKASGSIFNVSCQDAPWLTDPDAGGCDSPNWDIQRAHDLINHFATAFLLTELKGDKDAAKALSPESISFAGIKYETSGIAPAK
jgi:hypothetical protein